MSRNVVLQLSDDMDLPPVISINARGQKHLAVIIESLIAQGMASVPVCIADPLHVDSDDLRSVNVLYKDFGHNIPAGSLVVVNPAELPILDALLDATSMVAPMQLNSSDLQQSRRLTTGEGVHDPRAGRLFDRFFTALQQQDYDALVDLYHPDIKLASIVDSFGERVEICGRDSVIKNQKARWGHWIESYGPMVHHFVTTHISTHQANIQFKLNAAGMIFTSMYTISDYQLTSITHMKMMGDDGSETSHLSPLLYEA
jgi:hypothetical protein